MRNQCLAQQRECTRAMLFSANQLWVRFCLCRRLLFQQHSVGIYLLLLWIAEGKVNQRHFCHRRLASTFSTLLYAIKSILSQSAAREAMRLGVQQAVPPPRPAQEAKCLVAQNVTLPLQAFLLMGSLRVSRNRILMGWV